MDNQMLLQTSPYVFIKYVQKNKYFYSLLNYENITFDHRRFNFIEADAEIRSNFRKLMRMEMI